jgi:hypothetical protein
MFKKEAGGGLRWEKALRANPAVYNHQKKAIDSSNSAVEEEKIWRQPFISGATLDGGVQIIGGVNDWANRRRTQQRKTHGLAGCKETQRWRWPHSKG